MKIYIGADHRGFRQKEKIKEWLEEKKHEVVDYGAPSLDPEDDYTLYAEKVASMIADNPKDRGILFCGSGVGVDITANKFDGVRAGIGKESGQVVAGRKDDDMNVLVIAADFTSESETKEMIKAFIKVKFDGAVRHKRRLEDIRRIEENN